jgi:hypothetical protein
MSLYLIRTFGRCKDQTALKVGYTANMKNRMDSYKYHNPYSEMISVREGDLLDEARTHTYLISLGFKIDLLNEWFKDENEVLQLFHKPFDTMNKVIWNDRDKLFTKKDFISENKLYELYTSLRMMQSPLKKVTTIDQEWLNIINRKYVKSFNMYEDDII